MPHTDKPESKRPRKTKKTAAIEDPPFQNGDDPLHPGYLRPEDEQFCATEDPGNAHIGNSYLRDETRDPA